MKIGILTFHWAHNYGAVLQAHGLCQVLRRLGHTVQFIDYASAGMRLPWWQGWGLRSGNVIVRTAWRLRFDRFHRRYLPTTRRCRTTEQLRAIAEDFDAVIVGSDQVWNGNIFDAFDPAYFLDFVDNSRCRRISYAACFGEPLQPKDTLAKAGPLLSRFDFLSVRNELSAAIVQDLSGRNSEVVLDPTMLHDYSEFLGQRAKQDGYIAAYNLPQKHHAIGQEVLRIVKEKLGLPVILIGANTQNKRVDRWLVSAGPVQWLRLLQGASFICTNSFHGTIFAVKFKRPYIAWSGDSQGQGRFRGRGPVRIENFLATCGLENRLVIAPDATEIQGLVDDTIDYDAVSKRISPCISRSLAFLKRALTS